MTSYFVEPKLKVDRAKKHISDLNRELVAYTRKNPYRVVVDRDSEPGIVSYRVEQRYAIPNTFGPIIGDVIHNLRSSLDILACDVMRAAGRGVSGVYFPFAESADGLDAAIKERKVHRAGPDIVAIFKSFHPYKGAQNGLLRAIHDLNVSDKHKMLIPTARITTMKNVSVHWPDGSPAHTNLASVKFAHLGAGFLRARTDQNLKVNYDSKVSFEITFSKGALENEPVLPALFQMVQLVEQIIAVFERHLTKPRPAILIGWERPPN